MARRHPYFIFFALSFGASLILSFFIWAYVSVVDDLGAWVIAINIVTALVYIYDKWVAKSSSTRVPEFDLLMLAAFGGWISAGLCIVLLPHKIKDFVFQALFVLCVIVSFTLREVYYQSFATLLGR